MKYMKKPKTVKQLIKFFEKIPADQWCVGQFENEYGQHCALGHYNKARTGNAYGGCWNSTDDEIRNIVNPFKDDTYVDLANINNDSEFFGDSPKERVLVALTHLDCAGFKKIG